MLAYRKILAPIDFSPCSLEACRVAVALAEQFKAELTVLHVIDIRVLESLAQVSERKVEELKKLFHKRARLQLRSLLPEIPPGIRFQRRIASGAPVSEIVSTIRTDEIDLIVMGRYGGTGELEKIFFGSTVERVVRLAPCAVLSVPLLPPSAGRRPNR